MELENENGLFILDGFSYDGEETARAREIRKMETRERKDLRIKYFEIETGKKFPTCEPVEISLNTDTIFISSLCVERDANPAEMKRYRSSISTLEI